ncbi:hypothetical protein GCM10022376_19520 [Yimella lutea]
MFPRQRSRTVAAYRDRYTITTSTPLGAPAENTVQKIDAARARTALEKARDLAESGRDDRTPRRAVDMRGVGPAL